MTADKPKPAPKEAAKDARKKAFVVSPIGAPGTETHKNAQYALKYIYKKALDETEWEVHRADEGESPDSINQHVIKSLYGADLVIADLTGHNPNVFYELAIAHGIRKPVVHLISKGETMPFDIVDQRAIFYDITDLESVEDTIETLRRYALHAIEHVDDLVTPLSNFAKFNELKSTVTQDDGGSAMVKLLEEISTRISRLELNDSRSRHPSALAPNLKSNFERAASEYVKISKRLIALEKEESVSDDEKLEYNMLMSEKNQILKQYPDLKHLY